MTDEPIQSNFFRPRVMGCFIERLMGLHTLFQNTAPDNPILQHDLKDDRWLQVAPRARLHRLIRLRFGFTIVVGILSVLALLVSAASSDQFNSGDIITPYHETAPWFIDFLLGIALVSPLPVILICDLDYVMGSLNTLSSERETGRWEMMRLTPMPPKAILDAKYAAVQLKSWRTLTIEYLPRLYLLIVLVPFIATNGLNYVYQPSKITPEIVFFACALIVMLLFFFLEAGWRMRALIAVGLAISARSQDMVIKMISAFFVVVFAHVLEIICLLAPFQLIARLTYYEKILDNALFNFYLPIAFVIIAIGLLNYALFRVIREIAYGYALRHAFQDM